MQQYRLNFPLLIGLIVGMVVVSAATYGLWLFQINRNASTLIAAGEKAQSSGAYRDAAREFANYLSIRPDDDAVRVKLANLWVDVTEQPDVQPEDWGQSISYLEDAVRRMPEEKSLQRRLVDLYGRIDQVPQALDHLSLMLEKYPNDVELQVEQMQYLVRARKYEGTDGAIAKCRRLVGYDEKTDAFDAKKAIAPNDASVYANYASMLRSVQKKPELADRVMDQLVKVNPDLPAAYLERGRYLVGIGEPDRGDRDIQKAYKLAPDDADVLLTMAARAETAKKLDQAQAYLEAGRKAHPKNPLFYQGLAALEAKQQNIQQALALVDEGLKMVPVRESQNLLFYKSELQFMAGDVEGVRKTAEQMRKNGFSDAFLEWIRARTLLVQGKWYEASQALFEVQPKMGEGGPYADLIANQLGLAYEKSGQLDKARDTYEIVLQRNPANEQASAGKQRIEAMRGLTSKGDQQDDLDEKIAEILQQPKEKRNWREIDAALAELAAERKLEGAALDLFWARLMIMREDYAAARKYLVAGRNKDPENLGIRRMAVALLRSDPNEDPQKALLLLDNVVKEFGDQPELRIDRADCLIAINQKNRDDENLKLELGVLAKAPDGWTDEQRAALWGGMASRYLSLGMRDEARDNLERVAEVRPTGLQPRMALFALALEENDDVGMRAAQDKILEVVGGKGDSNWLYTEARRLLSLYRRGQLDKSALPQIRQLTDRAFRDRPNWFELHLVSAELDLLDGADESALTHFEKAQELGRPNAAAVLQHVRLLLNRGKFGPAKELIEQLPASVRESDLGQVYAEILLNTGNVDEAVTVAEKFAEGDPENAERQLTLGQVLSRAAAAADLPDTQKNTLVKKAGDAFQRAVELDPESPERWLALVSFEVFRKNPDGARAAIRDAQLALADDQLMGVLAKSYEIMGQWFNAENVYLTAYQRQPENLPLAKELATFYLSNAYPRNDKVVKAVPLVNQVLRAGADEELPPNDPNLMWARRTAAQILAGGRQYQQLLQAEKLLASNAQDGILPAEDRLRMAEILASRPEPISRAKARRLFEQVQKDQPLSLRHELMLGQLYFASDNWNKCKQQMLRTVSRFPDSVDARAAYVGMILQRGTDRDINTTGVRQMSALREIAPNDIRTVQLTAEIGGRTGRQAEVRKYLLGLLPDISEPSKIDEKQLPQVEFVAALLVRMGDAESAEKLYRVVVARDPDKKLALAEFLGKHRDVDASMQLLSDLYDSDAAEPTVRVAIGVIRDRRDEVGDKYDRQVQSWLERGLLENPDSIALLILQSEFDDVVTNYDRAAEAYQKLLARNDVQGVTRAVVLNNLAFLVAVAGNAAEVGVDPLKLVQEAAQILGPTADILDTRAVIYTANGDFQKAIEDLDYSVTDNPTPTKYFHKAVAHLGAGENTKAIEAWDKAHQLDEDPRSTLNRLEFDLYDKTKTKIESIRGQKLTRAAG